MQTVFLEDNLHELYFQALLSGKNKTQIINISSRLIILPTVR